MRLWQRIRRTRWKDVVVPASGVVVALLVSWVLWFWPHDRAQMDALSRSNDALRHQVEQLGATPVAPPASEVKANPSTAPTSVPTEGSGPTDEQVREAVAAYFQLHPVVDTTPPDPATVQAFVDAYLKTHPAPAGASGSPGVQGSPGTNGKDGAKGDTGRGVDHFSCDPEATELTVFYTDGMTQNLGAGSCGAGPKGDQGDPFHDYSYTAPSGPLGQEQTFTCTWDGVSKTEPHYSCEPQ